ncbi:hypothetical protein C5167_009565 [Papaver somniferum]|uniref:Uncharacterized protein n=1 Tax=Papaver somniferum TaxID=3469 RepID=A0A4Y7K1P2_PAPSO|nr:hypothetical protein C5167_009565 [Papaver somniferum]
MADNMSSFSWLMRSLVHGNSLKCAWIEMASGI